KGSPCKVGRYKPNRLGLYDMHGNVSEWCTDELTDIQPTMGGAYMNDAAQCRPSKQTGMLPTWRIPAVGLRLARVPVSAEPKKTNQANFGSALPGVNSIARR